MDSSIGIKGKDFVIIATDTTVSQSLVMVKNDEEKFSTINDKIILSVTGSQGDAFRVSMFTTEKAKYEELHNDLVLTPSIIASIFQKKVYDSLRKDPLEAKCLIGGIADNLCQLYSVDNYGAVVETPFAANGYAAYFAYGIFDMLYKKDLSVDEGLGILQECINVLKKRMVLDVERFAVKIVTNKGIDSLVMQAQ